MGEFKEDVTVLNLPTEINAQTDCSLTDKEIKDIIRPEPENPEEPNSEKETLVQMQQTNDVKEDERESLLDRLNTELKKISNGTLELIKPKDIEEIIDRAKNDTVLAEYLREKFPQTYGNCENLSDVVRTVLDKGSEFGKEFPKELIRVQLAIGGILIVVTGTGGPLGKFLGMACIRVAYKDSKVLNRILSEGDLKSILSLYKREADKKRIK